MIYYALYFHFFIVSLFLLSLTFKISLLIMGRNEQLAKVKAKLKKVEMTFGPLIILSGGTLLYLIPRIEGWHWVKFSLVIAAIVLGIIGIKKLNKPMAVGSWFLFIYIYGVSETKSLSFSRDKIDVDYTIAGADQLEKGKLVYLQACVVCHGEDGNLGNAGATPLPISTLTKEQAYTIIKKGRNVMPAFSASLSEDEIVWVTDYIQTLKD